MECSIVGLEGSKKKKKRSNQPLLQATNTFIGSVVRRSNLYFFGRNMNICIRTSEKRQMTNRFLELKRYPQCLELRAVGKYKGERSRDPGVGGDSYRERSTDF